MSDDQSLNVNDEYQDENQDANQGTITHFVYKHSRAIAQGFIIVAALLFVVFYMLYATQLSKKSDEPMVKQFCEGTQDSTISCPAGKVISVVDVKYGSENKYSGPDSVCSANSNPQFLIGGNPGPTWSDDPRVVSVPNSILNGKESETMTFAPNFDGESNISDPISGFAKYWEVTYDCV